MIFSILSAVQPSLLTLLSSETPIQYIGEKLLPGQLGHLLIIIAFVASMFSAFSFFKSVRSTHDLSNNKIWQTIGRISFFVQFLAIVGVFIVLYYIISQHLFEYHYAWKHSSTGLKTRYLLASFWEGSEGSFLLWIFWHAFLGVIMMQTDREWAPRVMTVVSIVQAVVLSMVLGIYLGPDIKLGSTPFSLLRDEMAAPIFQQANYLSLITDGNGLNPLLQNYWMVIHPPFLFLGFAMTLFPFAYAIAALWKNEYRAWVKPALRWSLMGGALLGAGIMMGGAWAYESLTFGGYWAWDPVENASLVPWLILIAGMHTLVIYKSTGRSLKITLIFFILTFLFVWYSTFLTRTGVLGETSVHSFTGKGKALYWHLIIVIGIFLLGSVALLIKNWKQMPKIAGEESADTREFWILIGSLFLFIASLQIIFYTSIPVWAPLYNKITGTEIAPPQDPITFYNNVQVWFAIIIALLSGAIQFLKYKKTQLNRVWKRLGIIAAVSLGFTILLIWAQDITPPQLILFTFSIFFALITNFYYFFAVQKGKLGKTGGGSLTHIGFAMMLLGILFSGYKKHVISLDRTGQIMDFGKETFEENVIESRQNVLLFRNTSVPMGDYIVTYLGDSLVQNDPPITYFKVRYQKRNPETNELVEEFTLYPDAFVNPKGQEGLSSNPDSRHYWTHDVFTYITSISDPQKSDTSNYHNHKIGKGDTIFLENGYLVLDSMTTQISNRSYVRKDGDIALEAVLHAYNNEGKMGRLAPVYSIQGNKPSTVADTLRDLGVFIEIEQIIPEEAKINFAIRQRAQQDDYVVLKVLVFPYIRLLWLGIIVMVIGFIVSWRQRRR